jgi:glycosyltransferase involved in cell wall biosynthesis
MKANREGRPRVLHCLWSGEAGGMERAVYQLVLEQLRGSVVAPSVLLSGGQGPYYHRLQAIGCPVTTLNLPSGHSVKHLTAARKVMREADIHHFHSAEPLLMLASLRCRGAKRIYTHRGGRESYSMKKRIRYGMTGMIVRHAFHGLSGNTKHGARCAAELLKIDESKVHVTYNGIEFSLLRAERPASEVRAELGIPENSLVLGTAAILKPWKRIDRLVRALPELDELDVRLLIVGAGPEREHLAALAKTLNVHERVVFTGLQQHVADFLQTMDVFCLPSTELESFGNAAVEAMVMGVPTIVFGDGGGTVEHIEDQTTGYIVDDTAELQERMRRLFNDADLRQRIGTAAASAIRKRYTLACAAAAYEELYRSAFETTATTRIEQRRLFARY